MSTRMISIRAELERTTRLQADAADPSASVWVSANAGTGKTHVLTMRVLRLLLANTPPERILCLTYTKAAAAEMSKRVFESLSTWVMLPEQELAKVLTDFLGRAPTASETALARTLFTRATETPGGLAVQTIHAFAERLLQRFPLEAGVTPGFAILDEQTAHKLMREAIDDVIGRAARNRASALGQALETAIAYAAEDTFDAVLADALRERDWLEAAVRLPAASDGGPEGLDAAEALYRRHLCVRSGISRAALLAEAAAVISPRDLVHIREVLLRGSKTDAANADKCAAALAAARDGERADALAALFLKSDGTARDKFLTKALAASNPEVEVMLTRAQACFLSLWAEQQGAAVVEATMALMRLADAVQQRYTEAKVRRAALDFDDLIARTKGLLSTRTQAEWVLYKLDNGLDHILVDESQDTSPSQWRVVEAMAAEFFARETARPDVVRTLFAVGDEKQSIYSFQGAAPEMFSRMGERFSTLATRAGVPWRRIPLTLSFRTVAPVLEAVDSVFADTSRTAGIAPAPHVARRIGQAGLVEIWPIEAADEAVQADAWSPLEELPAEPPEVRLANRIADRIKGWLVAGERLCSADRPITPGDILILVRKRQPFATPMVQALKARGIAVAGADRMRLAEQIAVQDLISLGDFLTLPEDDLALAEILKSPIFGLDDADLTVLAFDRADPTKPRKRTLWKALIEAGEHDLRFVEAATTLKRWRKAADFRPPFEFFADLLDRDGVRARLLARLGPDATDPLDEFLNLALTYDDGAPPSLAGFLAFMRDGTRDIKRDMEHGRDEVRVMTVHGAKGLEAPIVFLPDTCSAGSAGGQGGRPIRLDAMPRPAGMPPPIAWPVKGTGDVAEIRAAREALRSKDREERDRLLYVAMTRARDRLYIAGFAGRRGPEAGCWYELIRAGLEGRLERVQDGDGREVLRRASPQLGAPEAGKSAPAGVKAAAALPAWALAPVPREAQLTVPLAPSRLAPYDTDDEGEPVAQPPSRDERAEPAAASPLNADGLRFLRGTLTHALLEHLPGLPAEAQAKAAHAFLAARGHGLAAATLDSIARETLAILSHPAFSPVFGPDSQAEVPIVAVIERPDGSGPPLRLSGQLDRLAVLDGSVLIVDFKTNRSPARTLADVAPAYLYQLAAYRLALREIVPGKPVRAALLWTQGPHLMEIPAEILDSAEKDLWRLDTLPS